MNLTHTEITVAEAEALLGKARVADLARAAQHSGGPMGTRALVDGKPTDFYLVATPGKTRKAPVTWSKAE